MRHCYGWVRSCLAQIFSHVSGNVSINYWHPEGGYELGVHKRLSPQQRGFMCQNEPVCALTNQLHVICLRLSQDEGAVG